MGYGTLEHGFWDDPDIQEMGLAGMGFAAYVFTCRHATSEGYYRLPIGYVCDDLRIDAPACIAWFDALDLKNIARYDRASQVVFIRNSLRFHPPKGGPSITGALRRACEVPMNPFRSLFYDAAMQWAPDFAEALSNAGFGTTGPIAEPSLFEHAAAPAPSGPPRAPAAAPVPEATAGTCDTDRAEAIMRSAATISVQQSMARREQIRKPEAVAKSRYASSCEQWRPIVAGWFLLFPTVPDADMAKALADGGAAKPHWTRTTIA